MKVDVDTSRHVSLMNYHVLEVTPQVSMIPNNVLRERDHHLFYMKKSQLSKVDILKVQASKSQVSNIETLKVQVSKVQVWISKF